MAKEKPDKVDATPLDSEGGIADMVRQGLAIVKIENDTQMLIARQYARDEKAILEEALQELDVYKSACEQAIYSKPAGKDRRGVMKYARGLSIRAAESLGNRWANSAYALLVSGLDDESAEITGVFLDYEKNTRHAMSRRVSRYYKPHGSNQMRRHADDRFLNLVIPAHGSKLLREVILRSLPAGLKEEYRRKAEQAMAIVSDENLGRLLKAFAEFEVTQEQLEEYAAKIKGGDLESVPIKEFTPEIMLTLRGLFNAIEQKEMTFEEAMADEDAQPETPATVAKVEGAPTVEDVVAPTKEAPQGPGEDEKEVPLPGENKLPPAPEESAEPPTTAAGSPEGEAAAKKVNFL